MVLIPIVIHLRHLGTSSLPLACVFACIEDGANTMGASVRLDVGLATINTGLDTQPPSDKRGTTAGNFLRTRY